MTQNDIDQARAALDEVVSLVGTQAVLGSLLGKNQRTISKWRKVGVPAEYVLSIERIVNGKVNRSRLRPDIYPPEEYKGAAA